MPKRIYIILFFISYTSLLLGQEYLTSIRHYNFEKGLGTRDLRFTLKDSQGFLWFTSDLGAYRFDGYEFKNYKRKISTNAPFRAHQLGEDDQKNIWFNHLSNTPSNNGFSILPFEKDSLVSFDHFFQNKSPYTEDKIFEIVFKPPHFVCIIYNNGEVYEYSEGAFSQIFQIPNKKSTNEYFLNLSNFDIEKTEDKKYWISLDSKLIILSPEKKVIKTESLPLKYSSINRDHKDRIWLHYREQIYYKENINSPIKEAPFLNKNSKLAYQLYQNGFYQGYFLISNSLTAYELSLVNLDDFSIIPIDPFGVENINVSPFAFFLENPNSIWLTTQDGLYHIQLRKKVFTNYLQGSSTRKMILGKKDELWATSDKGLHKINLKEQSVKSLDQSEWRAGRDLTWKDSSELWMALAYNGVKKINPYQPTIIKEYLLTKKLLTGSNFNFIHQDKKTKQIWVGSSSGLFRYNKSKDDFSLFQHSGEFSQFDSIENIFFGEFEDINLISTTKGIFEFDVNKGYVQHYPAKNDSFLHDFITHIHQDKEDKTFWLGTKLGGLIHWDKKNNTSKSYTIQDGLSDDLIYAVYEDDDGFLWLPSNLGLMRFNKKTKEILTFTTIEGLPYDEFNYNSHFQDSEGNLYFGGLNGITTFHPKDFPKEIVDAPLLITNLEVLDTDEGEMVSKWSDFQKNNTIELSPSEKHFRATISLLDFQEPSANQYSYKIEGFENDWTTVEGNTLNIHGLPSGDFNLLIKAKNSNKSWTDKMLNIPIHVQKPIYLKWWFILSAIVLFFSLVYLFIKLRTANLRARTEELEKEVKRRTEKIEKDKAIIEQDKVTIEKQASELQKLDELKTRFFANVTHELRTPLTLITSPLQRLMNTHKLDEKTLHTLKTIAQNGEHLKDLVEEILDLSRLEGGKLNIEKKPVHFQRKVNEWFQTFEAVAHNRGIDYQLNYQLPSKLHLNLDIKKTQKIVFNLLSNAFKFSESGDSIALDISENKNNVIISVSDTGEGIHEDDLPYIFDRFYQSKQINQNLNGGLGIGLALSKELAHLMNGQLSVKSNLGKGTTFTFEFPKETIVREPVSTGENISPSKTSDQTPVSNSIFNHTILIVEDHPQMQAFIQELIQSFANTIVANNGKEALEILKQKNQNIQLIVSDVMMPEMDGFTFLNIIKNENRWQLIPIIMLTARADISDKLNALTIGVDDYLIKPFEPEELITRVKNLLENVDLRKKLIPSDLIKKNKEDEPVLAPLDSADMKWLKKLEILAFEKVTTPNFNIGQLAHEMAIGERQLNRKVKKITGMTPGAYLKEIKLQKARQLLENKAYSTVAEISYLIGFTSVQYFSSLFKERFGKLPSDYFKD